MNWTFGICTDGINNLEFHQRIIDSIVKQNIPEYEIIFCTENTDFKIEKDNIKTIYIPKDKEEWITKKKNDLIKTAKYENICLLHDYIYLDDNWYVAYSGFNNDWDVCCNQVLQLDGWRYFDWCTADDEKYGHGCVPYSYSNIRKMYVNGSYYCIKKGFGMKYPLDEELVWKDPTDSNWSLTVRDFWNLHFNPSAIVHILKDKSMANRNQYGTL